MAAVLLDSIPRVYRLTQAELDSSDFARLEAAIEGTKVIDGRGLRFLADRLGSIRSLLKQDSNGRPQFAHWLFQGSELADGCDFSRADFRLCTFDDCIFGHRVSFAGASFTRSLFRRVRFGNDACLERTNFGVRADFHSASFGDRARFSHSRFQSTQFFAARFGEEAGFGGTRFGVNARFHNARFGPRPNFAEARFLGMADFGGAYLGEKSQMMKVHFAAPPTFLGASFGPRARLTQWFVEGDLNMRSAHFLGAASLRDAEVTGNLILSYANFEGTIDLGGVHIGKSAYLGNLAINGAERFGPLHVEGSLDLQRAIIRSACAFVLSASDIDLTEARFAAPARISIGGGDVMMERVESEARLVLTTPQPIGVKMSPPRLLSVRGSDLDAVVVSGFDVRPLRFAGAEGIDGLRIESGSAFEYAPRGPRTHREVIAEEHSMRSAHGGDNWDPPATRDEAIGHTPTVGTAELSRIYRGLRKAREDIRDAPGAADFYYGEMEMRRFQAREELRRWQGFGPWALHAGSYLLLELYRLCGGYGVRPSRPLVLFAILTMLAAIWVDAGGLIQHLVTGAGASQPKTVAADFGQCLIFVLRSALLLPTSTEVRAGSGAEWIQIAARVLGPLLIGLFAFGMRARVHR